MSVSKFFNSKGLRLRDIIIQKLVIIYRKDDVYFVFLEKKIKDNFRDGFAENFMKIFGNNFMDNLSGSCHVIFR